MKSSFSISKAYWDKLSDKEKFFMQQYAPGYGVAYCKRILTLANNFPDWTELHCSRLFIKDNKSIVDNSWLVIRDQNVVGIIKKTYNIGISERLYIKGETNFCEIWSNWKTKNPNSSEKAEIAESVLKRIA